MRRVLLVLAALFLIAALVWPWLSRFPLGRLPGDLVFDRPGLKIYFPIVSSLLVGLVISLLMWLFRR
jgi:Protein of unknown function (DUF2905)